MAVSAPAPAGEGSTPGCGSSLPFWSWLFPARAGGLLRAGPHAVYGISFLFNGFNLQSIAMFAAAPLLLGLGQTFVIIAGGIDLSVGFVMGLAAVIMARLMRR